MPDYMGKLVDAKGAIWAFGALTALDLEEAKKNSGS